MQREPVSKRAAVDASLGAVFDKLGVTTDSHWDDGTFKRVVRGLVDARDAKALLEVGGGRDPLFKPEELRSLGAELTVNDISQRELDWLPEGYRKACFDIAGDLDSVARLKGTFDLIFSHTVLEHVADGEKAWRNMYELLATDGVAFAFIPTLYSLPFVANRLLPQGVAKSIVKLLYRHRNDESDPVFPARYSWTYATERTMRPMLHAVGYREILILPFYGHGYFEHFPLVRTLHRGFTEMARRRDWRWIASYAYIVARK